MFRSRGSSKRLPSIAYLLLPSAGIAFGMIAVFLGGVVPASPPTGGYPTTPTVFTNQELALLAGLGLAALLFAILAIRMGGGVAPRTPTVLVAVGILVAALFVLVLFAFANPSASPQPLAPPPPTRNATPTPPVYPVWQAPPLTVFPPAWPPWVSYSLLVVIVLTGALLAGPLLQALRYRGSPKAARPVPASPPRAALEQALSQLTEASGTDPRTVIIALYGQLLDRIGDRIGRLDPRTPREIEERMIDELGFRRTSARVLTELFEEARYSTVPLSQLNVDRARSSLSDALSALAPTNSP